MASSAQRFFNVPELVDIVVRAAYRPANLDYGYYEFLAKDQAWLRNLCHVNSAFLLSAQKLLFEIPHFNFVFNEPEKAEARAKAFYDMCRASDKLANHVKHLSFDEADMDWLRWPSLVADLVTLLGPKRLEWITAARLPADTFRAFITAIARHVKCIRGLSVGEVDPGSMSLKTIYRHLVPRAPFLQYLHIFAESAGTGTWPSEPLLFGQLSHLRLGCTGRNTLTEDDVCSILALSQRCLRVFYFDQRNAPLWTYRLSAVLSSCLRRLHIAWWGEAPDLSVQGMVDSILKQCPLLVLVDVGDMCGTTKIFAGLAKTATHLRFLRCCVVGLTADTITEIVLDHYEQLESCYIRVVAPNMESQPEGTEEQEVIDDITDSMDVAVRQCWEAWSIAEGQGKAREAVWTTYDEHDEGEPLEITRAFDFIEDSMIQAS